MKLNILSDLHLNFAPMELPVNDADVVILAGDIDRPETGCFVGVTLHQAGLPIPC